MGNVTIWPFIPRSQGGGGGQCIRSLSAKNLDAPVIVNTNDGTVTLLTLPVSISQNSKLFLVGQISGDQGLPLGTTIELVVNGTVVESGQLSPIAGSIVGQLLFLTNSLSAGINTVELRISGQINTTGALLLAAESTC